MNLIALAIALILSSQFATTSAYDSYKSSANNFIDQLFNLVCIVLFIAFLAFIFFLVAQSSPYYLPFGNVFRPVYPIPVPVRTFSAIDPSYSTRTTTVTTTSTPTGPSTETSVGYGTTKTR